MGFTNHYSVYIKYIYVKKKQKSCLYIQMGFINTYLEVSPDILVPDPRASPTLRSSGDAVDTKFKTSMTDELPSTSGR